MKTKEHLNQKYAHGPINLYDIYLDGYQDCKKDNENNFRREAAKDILCAMVSGGYGRGRESEHAYLAIKYADELIKHLKQE